MVNGHECGGESPIERHLKSLVDRAWCWAFGHDWYLTVANGWHCGTCGKARQVTFIGGGREG